MKKTILILVIVFLSVFISQVQAQNWQQVTTITGSAGQDTPYFSCNHTEWRITWSYTSNTQMSGIFAYVYDNNSNLLTSIVPGDTHFGLTYIHNQKGIFYLSIGAINVQSYTFTVEQDVSSIPETPALAALLFILLMLGTLTIKHRMKSTK